MDKELEKLNLSMDVVSNVLRSNDGDLREMVLRYILFLSTKTDCSQLKTNSMINDLLDVADKHNQAGQLALDSLINITSTDSGAKFLAENDISNIERILKYALNRESVLADQACKILSNVSRCEELASAIGKIVVEAHGLSVIVDVVTDKSYNKKGQRLEYMAQLFGNLTQSSDFQQCLVDPVNGQLQRVLPVISNGMTSTERRGITSALYNCLFDRACHFTLLQPPFEILQVLLYPLAGPEEFDDDDYEKMPIELQYLPEDKTRESDPHIRNLLLRSLLLLCSTKSSRVYVRDHNSYFILREYDKWETDRNNLLAIQNVIDVLIRTEDEIGVEDMNSLDVPQDLKEKFEKWDLDFINDK